MFWQTRLFTGIILILVFIFAVSIRLFPYQNFIDEQGRFIFYGPDSYDHLRYTALSIEDFPKVPVLNYYRGYPQGTGLVWSPLFDATIALFALIIGIGNPTTRQIEAISFFIPPILGALTAFPFYIWAKRTFDKRTALFGAAIFSIIPGHIVYTLVSEIDHHVIEPILALLFFTSFLSALTYARSLEERGVSLANRNYLFRVFSTAIIMTLILFYWRGSTIFWGAIMLFTLCQFFADIRNGRHYRSLYVTAVTTFVLAAAALTAFCFLNPWRIPIGMSFGVISWFHPLLLIGFASFIYLLQKTFSEKTSGIAIALLILIIALSAIPILNNLLQGIKVIGGKDPWLDNISELRSMFSPARRLDLMNPVRELTWVFWLSPFFLSCLACKAYQNRFRSIYINFFLIWTPYSLLIAVMRERYVHIAAISIAALSAYIFFWIWERGKPLKVYGRILSIIALFFLLSPAIQYIKALPSLSLQKWEKEDLFDSMRWLKTNTPKTSYYENPVHRPEYGIMADWGIGAYIEYMGERPAVASNFGWETYGLIPSVRFITATTEEMANNILDRNMVRYIVIKDPIERLYNSAEIAGLNPSEYILPIGSGRVVTYGPKFGQAMFIRLYLFDGTATNWNDSKISPLEHYRLVYESPNFIRNDPFPVASAVKIFEYVPGAKIKGKAKPGEAVILEALVETNGGRRFKYSNSSRANKQGIYEMTVPYSTVDSPYATRAIGPYILKVGDRETTVSVQEDKVKGL